MSEISGGQVYVGIDPKGQVYLEIKRGDSTYHAKLTAREAADIGYDLMAAGKSVKAGEQVAELRELVEHGGECGPGHIYLSTACLHGEHEYCKSHSGLTGEKKPGQCKFCAAPCVCAEPGCHAGTDTSELAQHVRLAVVRMADSAKSGHDPNKYAGVRVDESSRYSGVEINWAGRAGG